MNRERCGQRTSVLSLALSAALIVSACDGRKPPESEQPVDTTVISRAGAVSSAVIDSQFPGVPADYVAARADLLRRGLVIASDKPERPHAQYPELDCDPATGACTGLYLETDAEGWRHYVVVDTEGTPPRVTSISYPPTARGLPSIPPAPPADAPKLSDSYWRARTELLALGYRPAKAASEPRRVCAAEMASGEYLDCEADTDLPEIEDCSGTGMGFCSAYWIAPDRRVLSITTIGEPQPGGIYHIAWAKPAELESLPEGWRGE